MDVVIEIIGWVGSAAVLVAYGLNSYQKMKSDSAIFYILNLMGGLFLIVYTIHKEAYANAFINIAWVAIAGIAIVKLFTKQRTHKA